ncbi:MAG: ion transporter [Proteobacteria bacterium]|nr:ion transporter [Pseudomonadota bacterium]
MHNTLREKLYRLLLPINVQTRNSAGYWLNFGLIGLIVASSLAILLEFRLDIAADATVFQCIDIAVALVFLLEYLARLYAARNRRAFVTEWISILDLVVVISSLTLIAMPFLQLEAWDGLRLIRLQRILSIFRFFRILRLFRYKEIMHLAWVRLRIYWASLLYTFRIPQLLGLFVAFGVVSFAGAWLLYWTECANSAVCQDAPVFDHFGDLGNAYWSTLIMLISGIEDKEPLSIVGRIEAVVILLIGMILIGQLTAQIVSTVLVRFERVGRIRMLPPSTRVFKDHILILGANEHLDNIIRQVWTAFAGRRYIVVVDPNAPNLNITDPKVYALVFALEGHPSDPLVLERAGISRAHRAIVLSDPTIEEPEQQDSRSLMIAVTAQLAGGFDATVDGSQEPPFYTSVQMNQVPGHVAKHVLSRTNFICGTHIAEQLIGQFVLNPQASDIYHHLTQITDETNEIYLTDVPQDLVGKSFQEAQLAFLHCDANDITLIGVVRTDEVDGALQPSILLGADANGTNDDTAPRPLRREDQLLVIAYSEATAHLESRHHGERQ